MDAVRSKTTQSLVVEKYMEVVSTPDCQLLYAVVSVMH